MNAKPALLIIDMQKTFFAEARTFEPALDEVAEVISYVADAFRKSNQPVIFIQDTDAGEEADPGFGIVDAIQVQPGDLRVKKAYGNAFRDTSLRSILSDLNVDFLVMAGFKAEGCVLSTLKGAEDLDISYAVLKGGITSGSADGAAFVEKMSPLVSYQVVTWMLNKLSVSV